MDCEVDLNIGLAFRPLLTALPQLLVVIVPTASATRLFRPLTLYNDVDIVCLRRLTLIYVQRALVITHYPRRNFIISIHDDEKQGDDLQKTQREFDYFQSNKDNENIDNAVRPTWNKKKGEMEQENIKVEAMSSPRLQNSKRHSVRTKEARFRRRPYLRFRRSSTSRFRPPGGQSSG